MSLSGRASAPGQSAARRHYLDGSAGDSFEDSGEINFDQYC
jgi:hypothetical protein